MNRTTTFFKCTVLTWVLEQCESKFLLQLEELGLRQFSPRTSSQEPKKQQRKNNTKSYRELKGDNEKNNR